MYLRISEIQQVWEKEDPASSGALSSKHFKTFSLGYSYLNIRIFLLSKRNIHASLNLGTFKIKNKNVFFKDSEQLPSSVVHVGRLKVKESFIVNIFSRHALYST